MLLEPNSNELPIRVVSPGMERARKDQSVPLVIATYLHAAMSTGVEEHVYRARPAADKENLFFAHPRCREITWVRNHALVTHK